MLQAEAALVHWHPALVQFVFFFPIICNPHISVLQGTAPFMAIELLLKKGGIRHTPQHDLESLFYVLLYLCTNLDGPGVIRSPAELNKHSTIPLSFWLQASSSLHQIGLHKAGTLADFETSILKCFSPYFVDLQPCVYNMCRAIYGDRKPGSPSNVSHDEIIKIFTDTLDTLAPEAALPNTYQPLLTSSPFDTRKRSLGIHDGRGRLGQKKLKSSGAETGDVESSETNWAVVSGHNTLTTSSNRGRRGHASTSQSGGRRSRRPAAHSR
jgi:hypothetical protein